MTWTMWLITAAVLMIAEVLTQGFFLACFGVGALAGALAAALDASLTLQVGAFSLGAIVAFVGIRPLFMRKTPAPPTNIDAYVGREAQVLETLGPGHALGSVRVGGEIWKAKNAEPGALEPGERAVIEAVNGLVLTVRQLAAGGTNQ